MKEIKFRIWDKKLKEMHYQSLEDLCEDDYWYDGETDVWSVLKDCNSEQERFVIEQYTGLKDKNGKEIYEGDVVIFDYYSNGEINEFIIEIQDFWELTPFAKDDISDLEVIGNIYDNPELLKESN